MVVIVARRTFEAPSIAKEEEKRTTIPSQNCKNLPPSTLNIYTIVGKETPLQRTFPLGQFLLKRT